MASNIDQIVNTSSKKKTIIWSIILMVWPIILFIIVAIMYALVNLVFSGDGQNSGFNNGSDSPKVVFNVILFFVGLSCVITGPFSFIIGLVLLIVQLSKK